MIFSIMCLAALFQACSNKSEQQRPVASQQIAGTCVADTIIYSVVIKNPNAQDTWTEQCLSQLNRHKLVDQYFDAVYDHKAIAYSYANHRQLSISEIKDLEKSDEFSRDKIAKLQFWESWYFDEQKQAMAKKVHAVLLAYEIHSDDGEIKGYKAAFYIKMKG